ncbi:FKBP-type peptidyl-prolyl cis-trans isomerase N-terminal domain-containing protein, partial [Pseudoalteromonas issachenkonii]
VRTNKEEKAKVASEKIKEAGVKYLADNAKKEGVTVTESGLHYEVLSEGDGEKPVATDVVKLPYKGTLLD